MPQPLEMAVDPTVTPPGRIAFRHVLMAIAAVGLVVRAVYIFGFHHDHPIFGDAWVYHNVGRYVAEGEGWNSPWLMLKEGRVAPTADHPPLYIVLLALSHLLGAQSPLVQIALNGLIGAGTVVVIGLLGRRMFGDRAGLIAALIAALYPGLWSWNGQLLSESLSVLMTVLVMFYAYRFMETRRTRDFVLVTVAAVLGALTRGELVFFMPFVVIPLAWGLYRRTHDDRTLIRNVVLIGLITAILFAPWVAYNRGRFKEPVLISSAVGRALDSGSCDEVFFGDQTGFWKISCIGRDLKPGEARTLDESQLDKRYRNEAIKVMVENPGRVPVVLTARVTRMFNLYEPLRGMELDQFSEQREWWVSGPALTTYYLLFGLGGYGIIAMFRRRLVLYPVIVPIVIAAIGAMICFGTSRYRAPAEPSLVLLGAVGIEAILRLIGHRFGGPASIFGRGTGGDETGEGPGGSTTGSSVSLGFVKTVLPAVAALMLAVAVAGGVLIVAGDHRARGLNPVSEPVPPLPSESKAE